MTVITIAQILTATSKLPLVQTLMLTKERYTDSNKKRRRKKGSLK